MARIRLEDLASMLDEGRISFAEYCYKCNKVSYPTKEAAATAARDARKRQGFGALRPYPCPHGRGWHLTSMRQLEHPKHKRRRMRQEKRARQKGDRF